jgi:hypothetical protein
MKLINKLAASHSTLPLVTLTNHYRAICTLPQTVQRRPLQLFNNRVNVDVIAADSRVNNAMQHIPNILTISRVIMIPIFMLCYIFRKQNMGVMIYVLSCVTDLLDGYIARKFNAHSQFGALLDPAADKFMVAAALILLV